MTGARWIISRPGGASSHPLVDHSIPFCGGTAAATPRLSRSTCDDGGSIRRALLSPSRRGRNGPVHLRCRCDIFGGSRRGNDVLPRVAANYQNASCYRVFFRQLRRSKVQFPLHRLARNFLVWRARGEVTRKLRTCRQLFTREGPREEVTGKSDASDHLDMLRWSVVSADKLATSPVVSL